MKRGLATISAILVLALAFIAPGDAASLDPPGSRASVDPSLESFLTVHAEGITAPAVITYDHPPGQAEFALLESVGITKGFALQELPMVIADLNRTQMLAVRGQPGVISIWGNRVLKLFTNESRHFIGVPQLMADLEVTARNQNNPGFPISGKGIGVGYVDTGIDGTNKDVEFGRKTFQNVTQPLSYGVVSDPVFGLFFISISDLIADTGFVPPIFVEDNPNTDLESGHGTHGAGVTAGTGVNSGGLYGGVAPGAHLVGMSAGYDLGLPLVAILGAYDYLLVNQFVHNIRVINNSWGSSFAASEIHPNNPINVATRKAHDRNIVVVFAAGNGGTAADAINPYSTMPWTISVAAGEKSGFGAPAGFSSRGLDNGPNPDTAGQPADPNAPPNLRPDVTAPGVRVISARARTVSPVMNAISALNGDHLSIPPAFIPSYLSSDGTSFACPHVSGVVAMMLEANPLLTPDDVVTILRRTATPMPFEQRIVGAGYVDAHNAVRDVMGLAAVPHPANLMPPADLEILDPANDQIGSTAQDILSCDFAYDSVARQIVYTLTLADLAPAKPEMTWTVNSNFGTTTIFVTTAILETGDRSFRYGRITTLPTGQRNQETLGDADSGELRDRQIVVRLSIDKVNAAVGSDVINTTSTATGAVAQIRIGASFTPALLLSGDIASGSNFEVREGGGGGTEPTEGFVERFAGSLPAGSAGSVEIEVDIRLPFLDAKINFHPGNENLTFELLNSQNALVAIADESNERRMRVGGLSPGKYKFRVSGSPRKDVDFVIRSEQSGTAE